MTAPASPVELPQLPYPTLETNGDVFGHENEQGYTVAATLAYGQQCYEAGVRAREWRPIETAPKNGAPILACIAGQSKEWISVVCWVQTVEQWRNPAGASTYFNLTHWMPLPTRTIRKGE